MVEAIVTVISDTPGMREQPRELVVTVVCVAGCLGGLPYIADNGLYLLDIVDYYLNSFGMLSVGMLECIACGWIHGFSKASDKVWTINQG